MSDVNNSDRGNANHMPFIGIHLGNKIKPGMRKNIPRYNAKVVAGLGNKIKRSYEILLE